jgi:hypothetical protein
VEEDLGRLATRDPGGNQHFRNVFFKVQGKPDLRLMGGICSTPGLGSLRMVGEASA